MLSEHDIKRIQALFVLARRPIPKFVKVKSEKISIENKHGSNGRKLFLRDTLARLYDKFMAHGVLTSFSTQDLQVFPYAVFLGAEGDRPALYAKFPRIVSVLQKKILQGEDIESLDNFVHAFCISEAAVSCDSNCRKLLVDLAMVSPNYRNHAINGLFDDRVWIRIAHDIPYHVLTSEAVEKLTHGVYRRNTPFAREVFRCRLSQFASILTHCVDQKSDFHKELDFIRRETSRQNSQFVWPEYAPDFIEALLDPFSVNSGRFPPTDFQNELLTLLTNFFGDPDDPVNDRHWKNISQKSKDTLRFWKIGRMLFAALDMVREMTKLNFDARVTRHWLERDTFWKAYWRAGRIRNCSVFYRRDKSGRYRDILSRYGTIVPIGFLRDCQPKHVVLLIELDDNLIAAEVNSDGQLHLGFNTKQEIPSNQRYSLGLLPYLSAHPEKDLLNTAKALGLRLDARQISYLSVKTFGIGITHNHNWQRVAGDVIQYLSQRPSPIGGH